MDKNDYDIYPPIEELKLSDRTDDWLAIRRAQIKPELARLKDQQDVLSEERDNINEDFKRRFAERGSSSTRAGGYTISLSEDFNYPQIEDQTELEEFVLRTKKLHLLQKRISSNAVKEELAIREQEKEGFIKLLEEENWDNQVCVQVYYDMHLEEQEEGALANRIIFLNQIGKLEEVVKEELENYANLPGIKVVTKQTINAVKRG